MLFCIYIYIVFMFNLHVFVGAMCLRGGVVGKGVMRVCGMHKVYVCLYIKYTIHHRLPSVQHNPPSHASPPPPHTPPTQQGVILYGEPGTGKTLLAKAVANSTSATFLRMVGSELIQKYIGDGPKLVRELFRVADEMSPSIVFIGMCWWGW